MQLLLPPFHPEPFQRCVSESAPCAPVWSIVVFELDVFVELVPFALPTPNSAAVNTAAIGYSSERGKPSRMSSCMAIALAFGR